VTPDATKLFEYESDEDGRRSQFEYDNFYRLTKQLDALGNKTQFGYNLPDGTLGTLFTPTEIKFPTFTQNLRFDTQDRETSQTLLNPNHYDVHGNRIQLTDANGNTHKFVYDRNNRLVKGKSCH
jgi:YD repeat-containing protein